MDDFMKSIEKCRICPHQCGANRLTEDRGVCRAGVFLKVALASLHHWEEPCISGKNGSGTVFFSHCNLQCVFCQNYQISQHHYGKEITVKDLADIFLKLQQRGACNVNLVSPTQFLPQVRQALILAKQQGLRVPVVYNTNAYENVESLGSMEGLIDIYLPDLKYYSEECAKNYSNAPKYFGHATTAILEMFRQVGAPVFNQEGVVQRGVIIRHLLLPGLLEDSKKVLQWIKSSLPTDVYVSLMCQYTPMYKAEHTKGLRRRIREKEYEMLVDYFFQIGLENGYMQEHSSATSDYTPCFDLSGL